MQPDTMQTIGELLKLTKEVGWMGIVGFGAFLAYKISITAIISYSLIKTVNKVVDSLFSKKNDNAEKE